MAKKRFCKAKRDARLAYYQQKEADRQADLEKKREKRTRKRDKEEVIAPVERQRVKRKIDKKEKKRVKRLRKAEEITHL